MDIKKPPNYEWLIRREKYEVINNFKRGFNSPMIKYTYFEFNMP